MKNAPTLRRTLRKKKIKQSFQKFKRTFHFAMVPVQSKYYKFLENISVYAWRRSRGVRERSGGGVRYYNGWLYLYWLLPFQERYKYPFKGKSSNNGNNPSNSFMIMAIQWINFHIFSILILEYPSYPELSEQINLVLNYTVYTAKNNIIVR